MMLWSIPAHIADVRIGAIRPGICLPDSARLGPAYRRSKPLRLVGTVTKFMAGQASERDFRRHERLSVAANLLAIRLRKSRIF